MLQYLVIGGAVISLFGTVSYLREMFLGGVRPNKVSWLMWAVAPMIATFAGLAKGVTWAVLPVFMSGFGPICVLLVSFFVKKSYWRITGFDYLCGFLSAIALIMWVATKEPNIAIVFAILSDASAAIPTLKKSWTNPGSESATIFMFGVVNALTAFVAIKYWQFQEFAFPIYLVFINCTIILFILRRKIFKMKEITV